MKSNSHSSVGFDQDIDGVAIGDSDDLGQRVPVYEVDGPLSASEVNANRDEAQDGQKPLHVAIISIQGQFVAQTELALSSAIPAAIWAQEDPGRLLR